MTVDRRRFLKTGALVGGAVGLGIAPAFASSVAAAHAPRTALGAGRRAPLRILILGGTGFIGPAQVEYALARGDTLAWYHTRPAAEQQKLRAGIAPEKERAVLAARGAR